MDPLLVVSVVQEGAVTVVVARGVIDAGSVPSLEARLAEAIRRSPVQPPRIQVDLSGVGYLDRDGLDCLVRAHDRLAAMSGHLELHQPSPAVVRLLHQAELDGASWMDVSDQ